MTPIRARNRVSRPMRPRLTQLRHSSNRPPILHIRHLQRLHLHIPLKPLITYPIPLLRLHITGRPWPTQHRSNILETAPQVEWPMTVLLCEFPTVEEFACSFAARHEEDMIPHQRSRIGDSETGVDEQCQNSTVMRIRANRA